MFVLGEMKGYGANAVRQGVVAADFLSSVLQRKYRGIGIDDLYLNPALPGFIGNCCCVRAFNKASSFCISIYFCPRDCPRIFLGLRSKPRPIWDTWIPV